MPLFLPTTVKQLVQALHTGDVPLAARDRLVTGLAIDSRTLQPGEVFVALPGQQTDGHQYVLHAFQRGAVAALTARPVVGLTDEQAVLVVDSPHAAIAQLAVQQRQSYAGTIVGVTGSVGKTTTKDMLQAVLATRMSVHANRGNANNQLGLPLTMLNLRDTHRAAVFEMGASQPGDIFALAQLARPEFGVITEIGEAHLEHYPSLAALAHEKGQLLAALPSSGRAIINGQTSFFESLRQQTAARVVTVGLEGPHTLVPQSLVWTRGGAELLVDGARWVLPARGPGWIRNALLAYAVGRELGVSSAQAGAALAQYQPSAGRGALVSIGPWLVIDDTYNASPAAVREALRHAARVNCHGPRMLLLGDMRELGSIAHDLHRQLGSEAVQHGFQQVLGLGEFASSLAAGAVLRGLPRQQVFATQSVESYRRELRSRLQPGACLVVKGSRIMQMEQVLTWLRQWAAPFENRAA